MLTDFPAQRTSPRTQFLLKLAADVRVVVREIELIASHPGGFYENHETILALKAGEKVDQFGQTVAVAVQALTTTESDA